MFITKTLYRYLVLISWVSNLVWIFFSNIYWDNFNINMQHLLAANGYGSVIPGTEFIFWTILATSAFCYSGLIFFKRWSIWLLIALDIGVLIFFAPFGGVEVSAPVERTARNILLMTDGALISLAFFSDIRTQFK